jgi:hypothetical protein
VTSRTQLAHYVINEGAGSDQPTGVAGVRGDGVRR